MSALRFSLTSADPETLAHFYRDALGFRIERTDIVDAAAYGVDGQARRVILLLGAQEIELVGFAQPGAHYPAPSTSHDGWFQHLALVASDMDVAFARLSGVPGWQAISTGGVPVLLPPGSGGVRAFKFRDPEGHPLELLSFPPGQAPEPWSNIAPGSGPLIGIDHSAIAVFDVERSLQFYAGLGFALSGSSENTGPEQDELDGARDVAVSVRALFRDHGTPHLELLGYHRPPVTTGRAGPADVACTRVILAGVGQQAGLLADPDGHRLLFTDLA